MVEIAIVVFIIGLVVGGLLAGAEMLHQGKIKATITLMQEIQQANLSFKDQYDGYPGDLKNAATVLPGAAAPIVGDPDITYGNNLIENTVGGYGGSASLDNGRFDGERSQFFFQLGLAGLTKPYTTAATVGVGYPAVPLYPGKGMFVAGPWTGIAGSSNMGIRLVARDSMYLFLGVCDPAGLNNSSFNDCGTMTPEEAYSIDTKLDDGLPISGKIIAHSFQGTPTRICQTGSSVANNTVPTLLPNNTYDLSSDTPACNLLYSLVQ